MATPQQVLFAQLSVAHWTCQQMPAGSRVRCRILQLLEVALDLATCADTATAACMPTFPAPADAAQQQQQSPWSAPACTAPQGFASTGFASAGFAPAAAPSAQPFSGSASGSARPPGKHLCNRCSATLRYRRSVKRWRQQHKPGEPHDPSPSSGSPANPAAAATDVDGPSPDTPPARPAAAAARFAVCEAELLDQSGMSREQVSILAAAVHALESPYQQVHTAAAQKLQGITADWADPAAVGEALLEVGAVQELAALLSSNSSACRVAAAGTLCNISWYAGPRAAILAAGAVPSLVAMLWDDQQECREEAACALVALTSTQDEAVCAAVAAAGGIPRLVGLLGPEDSSNADGETGTSNLGNAVVEHDSPPSKGADADSKERSPNDNSSCSSGSRSSSSSSDSSWQRVGHESAAGSSAGKEGPPPGTTPDSPAEPNGADATAPAAAAEASSVSVADKTLAAAVGALGHLAAGSAARRAVIATSGQALAQICALLRHDDPACRDAALVALQHLTRTEPWRLSDGVVVQQVKAAGALEALRGLLNNSSDNCEVWQALRLRAQLEAPALPWVAPETT